jgi:hypothetical protein
VTDRPRFKLTLEALPADVPPAVRLRVALKRLARCYGLRCVAVEEIPAGGGRGGTNGGMMGQCETDQYS